MSGLPEADASVLEERALKMRKAMGENLADDVAGESVDSKQRRLNMIRCLPLDQSLCPPRVRSQSLCQSLVCCWSVHRKR